MPPNMESSCSAPRLQHRVFKQGWDSEGLDQSCESGHCVWILWIPHSLSAVYRIWYTCEVSKAQPKSRTESREQSGVPEKQGKSVPAIFYRTEAGGEPMREWLKGLSPEDRKRIGEDIKTVEFGWPIGMPVCKPMGGGVYEVRSSLAQNRIARVLFYIDKKGRMVLLHGFIKKTQKTPDEDLDLARRNKAKHQRGVQ